MIVEICDPAKRTTPKSKLTPKELKNRLLSFDWTCVDLHFVRRIHRHAQNKRYAQATRNVIMGVCRGIAKERWILGQITHDEYGHIYEVGKRMRERGTREKKSKLIPTEGSQVMEPAQLIDIESLLKGHRRLVDIQEKSYGKGYKNVPLP
jgi:hypothetical protein